MATLDDTGTRILDAAAALAALRPAIEAGRPWPLSEHFGVEPEASWGPLETLAHVAEMIPYWLGQIEIILDAAAAGSPPPAFGRMQTDVVRIGLIERDRILPPRELLTRITADAARAAQRLAELPPADGERLGAHPRGGETSVAAIAERFMAGHLEEHVRQIEEILAGAAAQ